MAVLTSSLSAAAAQMRYDLGRYRQEELPLDNSSRGGNSYSDLVRNRKPPKIAQGWVVSIDDAEAYQTRGLAHGDSSSEHTAKATPKITTSSARQPVHKTAITPEQLSECVGSWISAVDPNNPLRTIVYSGKCIISGSLQVRFEIAMEDAHGFMEYLYFWASATDKRRYAITDISTPTLEGGVCRFETHTDKKKYRIHLKDLEQTMGFQEALLDTKKYMSDEAQPPPEIPAAREVNQSRPVDDIQPLDSKPSAPETKTKDTLVNIKTPIEDNTAFCSLMEMKLAAVDSALREVVSLLDKNGGLSKHSALMANIAMRLFQDQDHNDWENPNQCKETVLGLIARMSSCAGGKNCGETARQPPHGQPESMRGYDTKVFSAKDMEQWRQDACVSLHSMSQDPDVQKHVYRPGADLKKSMSPSASQKDTATSVPNVTKLTERLTAMRISPGPPDAKAARQPGLGEKSNGQSKSVTDGQSVTTANEPSPSKTCTQEAADFLPSNSFLSDYIPMSPEMPQMNKGGKKLTDSM